MKGVPEAPQCGFSKAVCTVLNMEGVEFASYDILKDPDLREGIKKYSEWPTIPQVYLDKEFIGGCDIVLEQFKSGDLKKMLADAGLVEAPVGEDGH